MPLGSGDMVYRRLVIRETAASLELADCAMFEKFHRLGGKLSRAGAAILHPQRARGLARNEYPLVYYSKIEAWIFGEENALDTVLANHLREE